MKVQIAWSESDHYGTLLFYGIRALDDRGIKNIEVVKWGRKFSSANTEYRPTIYFFINDERIAVEYAGYGSAFSQIKSIQEKYL